MVAALLDGSIWVSFPILVSHTCFLISIPNSQSEKTFTAPNAVVRAPLHTTSRNKSRYKLSVISSNSASREGGILMIVVFEEEKEREERRKAISVCLRVTRR